MKERHDFTYCSSAKCFLNARNNGYDTSQGVFDLTYNSNGAGAAAWFGGDIPNYAGTGVYTPPATSAAGAPLSASTPP
jgi:hypothetical protein